ncbi:MAG TPA: TlpA disulfide reductase family protein [bacterium]|nr:TlpA disulfide reductase family protein [bacterium]
MSRGLGRWAALLLPVVALVALLAAASVRRDRALAIGAALARGETPPVPALVLQSLPAGDAVRPQAGAAAPRAVALRDLRGHAVVLNFWASWCVPCREEAPLLSGVARDYRSRGLLVVGVDTQDLESPARAFLAQYKVTYLNLRDPDGSVGRLFGTTGVPETFFIDADGRIQGKFPGEQLDPAVWRRAVDAVLAGRRPVP